MLVVVGLYVQTAIHSFLSRHKEEDKAAQKKKGELSPS